MIKSELIDKLAGKMTHLSEASIVEGTNKILEQMIMSLTHGGRIEIRGFGSFSLHRRLSRSAHNPKTGQKVVTKDKMTPHFKPGKELRERVETSRQNKVLIREEA